MWLSGAHLVLSSDYDADSFSPFVGMQNALNRGDQGLQTVLEGEEVWRAQGY